MEENLRHIEPYQYKGQLTANSSKSYFQRAMAIALLAQGNSTFRKFNWSSDTLAVCGVIKALGAQVFIDEEMSIIPGSRNLTEQKTLHVDESGLALRMFSSIAGLYSQTITLTGEGSLLTRPIQPIINTLENTVSRVDATDGKLPLHITGPLKGGDIHVDGSFGSQILSGLLISLPLIQNDSTLFVQNLTSRPYIDMTLEVMKHFGVEVLHTGYEQFYIKGNQSYWGSIYTIEGDWSSAANHLVGAAMSGEVTIKGLNPRSRQADRAILKVLDFYGANVQVSDDIISVSKNKSNPFNFDITHCPDLFPPIVALAASCHGDSLIIGTKRLVHKESNRLQVIIETFGTFGLKFSQRENEIIIHGRGILDSGTIDSHNDHRIAMAAAVAATITNGPIRIRRSEAVRKSYPHFFDDLEKMKT